jgi:hypothetical protein
MAGFVSLQLIIVLLLMLGEVVFDFRKLRQVSLCSQERAVDTYLAENGIPVSFGRKNGLIIVDFHHANRFCHSLHLALLPSIFLWY